MVLNQVLKEQSMNDRKNMFRLIQYLKASTELLDDKESLRLQGLTEEELDGYEEFFFENYYPNMEGEA
jgi:hypothetical protein